MWADSLYFLYVLFGSIGKTFASFRPDQKDFNNEIKNIKHGLMLNEYPQELVDSVIKPSTRNPPSSDRIYQDTAFIQYVKGISEKFRSTGNRLNLRKIFKTKHTLRETLVKTGPVRDAQQKKQLCIQYLM
jgi:hypothetical protein